MSDEIKKATLGRWQWEEELKDKIDTLRAEVSMLRAEKLDAEIAHSREIGEQQAMIDKLADILTRTANMLKGPPAGDLFSHSWADLPEKVTELRDENVSLKVEVEDLETHLEGCSKQVAKLKTEVKELKNKIEVMRDNR